MTSRISLAKLLKEDIKHNIWLWALSVLFFFLAFPVAGLMGLGNKMQMLEENYLMSDAYTIQDVIDWYNGFISYDNVFVCMMVVGFAVVSAITCFRYLHSKVKMDFYHSLPVRREKFFAVQYLQGVLLFVLPYLLNLILILFVGVTQGVLTGEGMKLCAQAAVMFVIFYLLCYTVAVLAMMLTGKVIVGLLGTAVFYIYGPAVWALNQSMQQCFYDTFSQSGGQESWAFLSPVTLFILVIEKFMSTDTLPWVNLLCAVIAWIVLTCIAVVLYRKRSSEAAEKAMAFEKTESVIKVLMLIPASIAGGMFISEFSNYNAEDAWRVFGIIFCLLIGNAIVEFIYHMDFRELFRKKLSLVIAIVITFALFLVYRFDLTGYDNYMPEEDKIEQMAIFEYDIMGNAAYPDEGEEYGGFSYGADAALSCVRINDFEDLYNLIKTARNVMLDEEEAVLADTEENSRTTTIYVRYYLKSGKEAERCYNVPVDSIDAAMEKVYKNAEFRQKAVDGQYIKPEQVIGLGITDITQEYKEIERVNQEDMKELLAVYQKESMQISYRQLTEKVPIASMEMRELYENGNVYYSSNMLIYDTYTETLECLRKIYPDMKTEVTASDIEEITFTWEDYEKTDSYQEVSYKDPEQIAELMESIDFGVGGRYRTYYDNYYLSADIYWKDFDNVTSYEVGVSSLPEFVKGDLNID